MLMPKRFHCMKLVENIGVKKSALANNLSYPRIKKKLLFSETSDQYLVANNITCWSDGYTLRNSKHWIIEMFCLLAGANLVSLVNKRKSFGIFHNSSCILELLRVWFQATEYAILLGDYIHAFSPGVDSGVHSYCDYGKSLLKTIFRV